LEARALHTLRLIARQPPTSVTSLSVRLTGWPVISTVGSIVGWTVKPMFTQFDCQSNSSTVESTVGPTVRPTVRSILKLCKCAITLVGKLPVITGRQRRTVLSADAGLLVLFNNHIN